MIDAEFAEAVRPLLVPEMGTEVTAPLLYWLVRQTRPRTVVEVGMGYTTPHLALALRDNRDAVAAEREALRDPASAAETHPMALPSYYESDHRPRLLSIDRMTDASSSAPRVWPVIDKLGLSDVCEVLEGDMQGSAGAVADRLGTIDLAWIDTWDTLAFLREYWPLVDPAGGMLAVHWIVGYPEGRAVQHYLRSLAGPDGGRLEFLNLVEPHKFGQSSVTVVRRIRDYSEPEDLRPGGAANDPAGVLTV